MLTKKPTSQMIEQWKKTFEESRSTLRANRKTGIELIKYFENKYLFSEIKDKTFQKVVELNITENEHSRSKLPAGAKPDIKCYRVENVLVGIDVISGEFHVECEEIEKASRIYDDLFAYRGLDEEDLQNYFLVAQYINLTQPRD